MKKTLTLLIITLCVFFASCSSLLDDSGKIYWIDNPLDHEITVKIDDAEHKIAPKSSIKVKIEYGTHELSYDGQKVKFIAKPCFSLVVLNPTLSNYISYAEIYYYSDSDAATDRGERLLNSFSQDYDFGDGVIEKVPFRVFNSFIIEGYVGKWDYDLDTSLPEEIVTNVAKGVNLSADMKIKLFREEEFIEFIGEDLGLQRPKITKLDDLAPQQVIDEEYLSFDCEKAQPIGDSLKVYINKLYTTSGKEFSEAYKFFTSIDENRKNLHLRLFTPELQLDCNKSYDQKNGGGLSDPNYMANEMGINEALSNFQNINAWIVK
ncbi:MAG: hypothetical protein QM660_04945 [Dysgonomonas sp.]